MQESQDSLQSKPLPNSYKAVPESPNVRRAHCYTMHLLVWAIFLTTAAVHAHGQQIYDIWQTTWDRQKAFTYTNLATPINFVTPGLIGDANIVVTDSVVYQTIDGFGGTLTDGSALTLYNLKSKNSNNYWSLLGYLFNPTDGANSAGLTFLRVTLAASDFSANDYSYDDVNGDSSFNNFNIGRSPSYLFSVIKDIQSINPILKVHLLPWSPSAWAKDSGTMNGGSLQSTFVTGGNYANYLLKALQGFKNQGITAYSIAIQNEPENGDTTYPSCTMTYQTMGQIGTTLRTLMNNNGFSATKIIGYEHNWADAANYPTELMQSYGSAFSGVSFHCYAGSYSQQQTFYNAFPNKEIYMTECTGTLGSDWWTDIKWYMDNLYIGSLEYYSRTALMWNIALDGNGNPKLSGADSCNNPGCRGIVTVNSDGSYSVNQEFYVMAQASKAILPKDSGGPWGQRIEVSVGGNLAWGLRVGAYVTARVSASDWLRYSLVVLDWDDSSTTTWNPVPIKTTIAFRGAQATYTFPVGVTTLWWYAASQGYTRRDNGTEGFVEGEIHAENNGRILPTVKFEREAS